MSNDIDKSLAMFLKRCGVSMPLEVESVRAGRNSEVLKLSNDDGQWILKNYYRHPGDSRDRVGTEFGFLEFLRDVGFGDRVPRPLGVERDFPRALYSFLSGKRLKEITAAHVSQAANFVLDVNQSRTSAGAKDLPAAADACFSLQDHLELAERRVGQLMNMTPESELEVAVHAFVGEQLQPCCLHLSERLRQDFGSVQRETPLAKEVKILSPSDFGFHNTLECNGELSFVDFEYAGWDDPAKLVCDFLCQPEMPVSDGLGRQFMNEVLPGLPQPSEVGNRVAYLLPFHRLKWCCILLNEFREEGRQRRLHAGVELSGLLAAQFGKAKRYYDMHLALLN